MVSRTGDKSGEEILEKMNAIKVAAVAHTDELVKSVGSLIAEQKEKLEGKIKVRPYTYFMLYILTFRLTFKQEAEENLPPEMASLQKTIALVDNTCVRVDKVLAAEAKRMEKDLCSSDGDARATKNSRKRSLGVDDKDEMHSPPARSSKAVRFETKAVDDDEEAEGYE